MVHQSLSNFQNVIVGLRTNQMASTLDLELFKTKINSQIGEVLEVFNDYFGQVANLKITQIRFAADLTRRIDQAQDALST